MVPVYLGGRRDEHPLAKTVAAIKHGLGALDVGHQGAYGLFDNKANSDGRGQVVDDIALLDGLVKPRKATAHCRRSGGNPALL